MKGIKEYAYGFNINEELTIYSKIDEEFLEYTGYNAEMIYQVLEQNLYSRMWFYVWEAVLMSLTVLIFYALRLTGLEIIIRNRVLFRLHHDYPRNN